MTKYTSQFTLGYVLKIAALQAHNTTLGVSKKIDSINNRDSRYERFRIDS